MRIAVIGGKLQGVEIVYLALKAGFKTLVIDKDLHVPAGEICDHFLQFHILPEEEWPLEVGEIDLIFPALEDVGTLAILNQWASQFKIPIVLDFTAYQLSNSKNQSNALFKKLHLPLPAVWPDCSFPVVVKPDQASGSSGVFVASDEEEIVSALSQSSGDNVVQEYLEGPSFSVEIIGRPGNYLTLQVTDLVVDRDYDCCGVGAPTILESRLEEKLHNLARTIAEEIALQGIMDLEVILHEGELKILEIDARFPSQTPIAVFLSTGMNMVEILTDLFVNGVIQKKCNMTRHARLDHVRVHPAGCELLGEHIMAGDGPLKIVSDFFGADEALTTFMPGKKEWVATLLFYADSKQEVEVKRERCLRKIARQGNTPEPLV